MFNYSFFSQEKVFELGSIKVKEKFRTELNQFLLYFDEFVLNEKGKKINLNISSDKELLELKVRTSEKQVNAKSALSWFKEYLSFIYLEQDFEYSIIPQNEDDNTVLKLSTNNIQRQIDSIKHGIRVINIENLLSSEDTYLEEQLYTFTSTKDKRKQKSLIRRIPFYPGGLWIKRLGHILVMFTIGINIFLNNVQDIYLDRADLYINKIDTTSENIRVNKITIKKLNISNIVDLSNLDTLKFNRIGKQGFLRRNGHKLASLVGFPSKEEINRYIDSYNGGIDKLKRSYDYVNNQVKGVQTQIKNAHLQISQINERVGAINSSAGNISINSKNIRQVLKGITAFLKITSFIMWIPILISALWLYLDLKKGNTKIFVFLALGLAIPANYFFYEKLTTEYNRIELQIIELSERLDSILSFF